MITPIVVGTAGHIDHGKTSLIRALTGVDLDRLPEEQRRGITIQLGFTPLDLPDGRRVAFVDVPGHEGLVRTMIAGAQGVDAALLCVSAVDGVMPQTREHLAILDLLGVADGAVVLTKVDLVDADMLELAEADVEDVLRGTCLEGRPIVRFSALTGAGKAELLDLLGRLQPRSRPETGPFRLPVDRAFTRPGFGTVVTGTSAGGRVKVGDTVKLLPEGRTARVRGLEVHGAAVDAVGPGRRVAVNLGGVETDEVPRGTLVTTGEVPVTSVLDIHYRHTGDDVVLEDGMAVRVLIGTAEGIGHAWFGGRDGMMPGEEGPVQLRMEAPIACLPGDAVVLRRPSPASTLGGGVVLDPWAPRLRPRDTRRWSEQLTRLRAGDREVLLERAGPEGVVDAAWAGRGLPAVGRLLGERRLATSVLASLEAALTDGLAIFHALSPLALGIGRGALRRGALRALGDKAFGALVAAAIARGEVMEERGLLRLAGHTVHLTEGQLALQAAVLATIEAAGLPGVEWDALKAVHPQPEVEALVALLAGDGRVVHVPNVGLVAQAALEALRAWLAEHFATGAALTPATLRDRWELSRKTMIPLLEWTDRSGWTARAGDERRAGAQLR